MDFKYKGKTWVGNIYQKFEAMCQEVDDFVSQDTVKSVENQVQDTAKYVEKQVHTVGESVKRFCSDVVLDLVPTSLVDPAERNAQEEPRNQNDSSGTYSRSMISIEEKPVDIDAKQSSVEQDQIDPLFDSSGTYSMSVIRIEEKPVEIHAKQSSVEGDQIDPLFDSSGTYSRSMLRIEQKPVDIDKKQSSVEWNQIEPLFDSSGIYSRSMVRIEEKPVDIDMKQSSVEHDQIEHLEYHRSSSFNMLCPLKQIPYHTKDPVGVAVSDLYLEQDYDALMYRNSEIDTGQNVIEGEQSSCVELSSPEYKDSTDVLSSSEAINENDTEEIIMKVPPATLVHEVGFSSMREATICSSILDEIACVSKFSSTPQSSEPAFSVISSENKVVQSSLASSSCSLSTESCSWSEFSQTNFPLKEEKICYKPTDAGESVSDLSSALSSSESFPTIACGSDSVDVGLAFSGSILSLDSNDTSGTDEEVSVDGSSGNKLDLCCKCTQLEAYVSSLQIGQAGNESINIADPSMENIDLSDKMKLDESCVIVDNKLLYAVSCRARKHRSYKKIIQDAFSSRKRLLKEYEQLPIWYGDIDIESSQQQPQNLLSSMPTTSLESKNSATRDLCDSEWELL